MWVEGLEDLTRFSPHVIQGVRNLTPWLDFDLDLMSDIYVVICRAPFGECNALFFVCVCRLKCHNKCTKEAPSCRISFLPSKISCYTLQLGGENNFLCLSSITILVSFVVAKIRRTESVPSDINNPVDRPAEAPQFGTLPKAITKKVKVFMNFALHHTVSLCIVILT